MRSAISVVLILTLTSSALGAEAVTEEAKVHVRKATAAYNLGKYLDAAKEYEAAYEQTLDANLLFNVAQAYRLAGEREKAITTYRSFVRSAPKSEQRSLAETKIRELEAQRALAPVPAAVPTAPPAAPAPAVAIPAAPQGAEMPAARPVDLAPGAGPAGNEPASQALSLAPAPTPEASSAPPFYKRWPFWTAVGVLVAGGVTLGIVLSSRSHDLGMPSNTKEF